ncbi:MAG: sugar transferase, partial [Alphaproteobacteria bacterium]
VTDAEKAGAQFAKKDDLRITSFGRFIRKYRIDEWPQLVNVLRGDMSLIGPRPEQADLVDRLSRDIPLFPFRHSVRPGITGWAQVCQGYAYDVRSSSEKLTYDLYYVKHLSLMLDLMILLRTIKIIVSGSGAR